MRLLQKTIRESQENVSGEVKLRLYKGSCIVLGRRSAHSLYSEELATFEKDDVYRQKDAEGFIRLQATRLRVNARLRAGSLTAAAQPSQEGKCKPQPSNDVNKLVPWQNT
jgi:argininosuccinate synthase